MFSACLKSYEDYFLLDFLSNNERKQILDDLSDNLG